MKIQAALETLIVFIPIFCFVYLRQAPTWNYTPALRLAVSIIKSAIITVLFWSAISFVRLLFFIAFGY